MDVLTENPCLKTRDSECKTGNAEKFQGLVTSDAKREMAAQIELKWNQFHAPAPSPLTSFHSAILLVLLAFFSLSSSAQTQNPSPEYKLKAVFLFNFVQYIDWPTNAFANEKSPLIIGILGDDPFGKFLDETVKGEAVKGRKLQVRRYRNVSEIKECHILYISTSEAANLKPIMAALKGRSILTVSDIQNFTRIHRGMIRFLTDQNKIRFSINLTMAKEEDLTISSKLLQLADIVR